MDTSRTQETEFAENSAGQLVTQLFVRSQSVVSRRVAGETLIVPVRGKVGDLASIYSFNSTGSLIWQSLESPKCFDELVNVVESEYAVERDQAEQDVKQFLHDMLAADLSKYANSRAAMNRANEWRDQIRGTMEQLSYGAFSADLHHRQSGKRAPMQVSIEVTRRCPLECQHCYNNLPMGDQAARSREMTTEEHFKMLDELVEMGCFWLIYTGGEIFARKDFLDIYTYAKKKGFLITLFTNGTLITEKIADYLVEWPPFAIEITLYGRTRETYEALTQIPGSYDRCLRGIKLLARARIAGQVEDRSHNYQQA